MSNNPFISDVFKFVALRPPVSVTPIKRESYYITDKRNPSETPVGKLISSFHLKDSNAIITKAKEFIKADNYSSLISHDKNFLFFQKIQEFVLGNTSSVFEIEQITKTVEDILGTSVNSFLVASEVLHNKLWDLYYAFVLVKTENEYVESLTTNLQIFHLLECLTKKFELKFEDLHLIFSAKPVISNFFTTIIKPTDNTKAEVENPAVDKINGKYVDLWIQLVNTHNALSDVGKIKVDIKSSIHVNNLIDLDKKEEQAEVSKVATSVKNWLSISSKSLETLTANSKNIISQIVGSDEHVQISDIVNQLKNQFERLYLTASKIKDSLFFEQIPEEAKLIPGLSGIINKGGGSLKPVPITPATGIRKLIRPLGIGDLKVVKQTLTKYTAKEISHIENVLRGEYKERTYRELDRTENIFVVSNETDEETTKDTQTTERFELQKESEKTLQEQMNVQAGVTVSGSYGMVTFGAHGDFAYSTSNEESNKSSSNFAREVIDKSVSKIQKKTKEERTTKNLHEVEEINKHGIDNKDKSDHAVGIYLWVDKHYEAQIYNYGKRMMFEFIIPEPAAFYQFAQSHSSQKNDIQAPKPLDPDFTYKNIESWNVDTYIRDYNVQGITPAPPLYKTISTAIVKDGMPLGGDRVQSSESSSFVMNSKELIVPANYISRAGVWWDLSAVWTHYPKIEVTIGNKIFRPWYVDDPKKTILMNDF